jgi:hypothetical protein
MARQEAEGRRQEGRDFWTTLLSVTYFDFFAPFYIVENRECWETAANAEEHRF